MPKITLKYPNAESVPAELKGFCNAENVVEIWAGASQDAVAAELNPGLAQNRDTIKGEKDTLQRTYDNLLASSSETSREVLELRNKIASGNTMSADEVAIVSAVKAVMPTIKADALKKELEALPNIRTELETIKTRDLNREIFGSSGFKNEKVFLDLLGNKEKNPNLTKVEIETETVDGKPVKKVMAHIKGADGTTSKQALSEYVKGNSEWEPYVPVLTAGGQSQDWLPQSSSQGGSETAPPTGGNPVDDFIAAQNKKAKETPNPLYPRTSAPAAPGANVTQN